MLQCASKQAKTSYYIRALDIRVTSLEELNYVVYNHMNMIYREFFSEELFAYLEDELDQAELAGKLRKLEAEGGSVKDLIFLFFNESYYYGPADISRISPLLANIDTMTRSERMIMEAEKCFREKKYGTALRIYSDIYAGKDDEAKNDRFYAKVAFSIGIIYARLFMTKNANAYFAAAYELYPDPAYAKAGVYMSVINHDDEELLRAIIRYKISDEALAAVRKQVDGMRVTVLKDPQAAQFINEFRADPDSKINEIKEEYYNFSS